MYEDYDVIDGNFMLDWNKNSKDFNFYYQKYSRSSGHNFMLAMLTVLVAFFISSYITLFVLNEVIVYSSSSYEIFTELALRAILYVLGVLFLISIVWFLFEIIFISPRFRLNKSSVIYITDGKGLYIVDYRVSGTAHTIYSHFPSIVDKIIDDSNIKFKFKREFFKSVSYINSYNVVSSTREYVILDVPEDNPIYDDLNDFEINNSVIGFSELRSYLDSQDGGLYLE